MKRIDNKTYKRLEELHDKIGGLVCEANTLIAEYNAELGELAQEAGDYFDGRSERWQEGDVGSAYESWKENFDELLDELEEPDDVPPQEPEA